MCIVFVEYKIEEGFRDSYLEWMEGIKRLHPQLEVYEGTDQSNLFVEIWSGLSEEEYRSLKELRTGNSKAVEDSNPWSPQDEWVPGGRAKIHIWQFKKVK